MGRESLMLVLALAFAMAIMGWIIWSERPVPVALPADHPVVASSEAAPAPVLDEARVAEFTFLVEADPDDAESRRALANVYFEAQRFEQAILWYEEVLTLDPDDVESSTRLGVCFYYGELLERAVEQFERSLEIEPDHAQTLLSLGIVKAFGLEDPEGAIAAWERVLETSPDGAEARGAREALDLLELEFESSESNSEPPSASLP